MKHVISNLHIQNAQPFSLENAMQIISGVVYTLSFEFNGFATITTDFYIYGNEYHLATTPVENTILYEIAPNITLDIDDLNALEKQVYDILAHLFIREETE